MRRLIAGCLLIGFAGVVVADQYRTVYTIPLHGGTYQGQPVETATGDVETRELLKLLLEEIRGLREDVAGLKSGVPAGASGVGTVAKLDGKTVAAKSCASCHSGKSSKGGFPMFADDGKTIRELSRIERKAVESKIREGSMPPAPAKLSAEQSAAILSHYAK